MPPTRIAIVSLAAALAAALTPARAAAAGPPPGAVAGRDYAAGEVVVRYAPGAGRAARAAAQRASGTKIAERYAPHARVLRIRDGRTVAQAIASLERRRAVLSATPSWIAHASFVPDDPGTAGIPGGWQQTQWNLGAAAGINAPAAWDNLIAAGRPGGRGVVVAVIDSGVAYTDRGGYRRSPDFSRVRFRRGYDFVDHDTYPLDVNGHGTHVASTIAETANNGIGVPGIAYGVTILPVRVLNRYADGQSSRIARAIRYAVAHGANVINLSFEFQSWITGAQIPDIIDALEFARRRGVVVVAAAGNEGRTALAYPARAPEAISVGATTEHLCLASYSNDGQGLDLVAPGGGGDAELADDPSCRPTAPPGGDIYQMTWTGSPRRFGLPGLRGTSMATAHVSAVAALVIASGAAGPSPTPDAVEERLKATARDLGLPGYDTRYGAGLVDAAAATTSSG